MTVFAILCHNEAKRLSLLLETLAGFDVIIHIDKYAKRQPILSEIKKNDLSRVFVIPEHESVGVAWGGYSIVEAQMKIIEIYLGYQNYHGSLVFLSGQDFPLRPITEFAGYLEAKGNLLSIQVIDYSRVDAGDKVEISRLNRVRKLHGQDLRFFRRCKDINSFKYRFGGLLPWILRKMKIPNLRFDKERIFIGSQWIAISRSFCEMVLQNRHSLKKEFKYAFCPDEISIQSLFGRSIFYDEEKEFRIDPNFDSVIDAAFHLIHPTLNYNWKLSEFDSIMASSKFFIRKPSWDLLLKLHTTLH